MKYICVNPEEIVEEVNKEGIYGRGRIMSRITLGTWEAEYGLFCNIINPCINFLDYKIEEADISDAFNYLYIEPRCNVMRFSVWRELKGLFDIKEIIPDKNGNYIIKVEYLPKKRLDEDNTEQNKYWEELEKIYQSLTFLEYSETETSIIVKTILDKYINDLSQREDIIYQEDPICKHTVYLGGGHSYQVKGITYIINGEEYIVKAILCGSDSDIIKFPNCRFPSNKGYMEVQIIRKAQNGEEELIAKVSKSKYKSKGCEITIRRNTIRNYSYDITEKEDNYSIILDGYYTIKYDINDPQIKSHLDYLISQETIDKLQELFWSKVKFEEVDEIKERSKKSYEITDWQEAQKRQVIAIPKLNNVKSRKRRK